MKGVNIFAASLLSTGVIASPLQLLPPTPIFNTGGADAGESVWDVQTSCRKIYIEEQFASQKDDDGLTLIPPSGLDFAEVFLEDINHLTSFNWSLETVESLPDAADANGAILLGAFTGDGSATTYENGESTSEAYELDISSSAVFIGGTSSRGMWWGTRTILQLLLLNNNTLPLGRVTDAPAYETRGYMFDAGRKWYTKDFLKEMCSYASFFKMNEFHYHLSDNYPLNRGDNDTWQDVYSHFSLLPEDESLLGIIHGRENETLSREDYADMQGHCARRGIAVIPEIEAPGHCLYVTKWKPELSLEKRDLLNLSHPETIPTIQRIWAEFLPWFDVKEVHVGADEYDATLADDYIGFVNEMADFVNETSGKNIRIWGTPMDEPEQDIRINPDIHIQHWQFGQSDPLELIKQGHHIINSQDWWAYVGIKNDHSPILPATYPQFFNESRILDFAEIPGWQWTPSDFNHINTTEQPRDGDPQIKGAVMAAWNDNGPDASTKLEMYYAMRRGIALIGARAWSGSRGPEVQPETLGETIDFFSPLAPAQNLDRVVDGPKRGPLFSWTRSATDGQNVTLGKGSKGMNYTLTLVTTGPFVLSSSDTSLTLTETGSLFFNEDGYIYPLRSVTPEDALELDPGHPGRIWVNTTSTHDPVTVSPSASAPITIDISTDVEYGAVVWLNGELAGRFEVFVYGGRNTQFSWSQMAFVAPLETVEGVGLQSLRLETWTRFVEDGCP
ncbi:glycoside hydrolase superfamily [Aspergillus karnatakaensis]|uniref:glycoside hydrolase superfamily n=1 Tax=Aspergillus karnatakaensis TaxID=1810916 RepID=UPI003CCE367C